MSRLGQVRIGHKAPDFHCEAVIGGAIREVSLSTFVRPWTSTSTPDAGEPWLLLLFIPAAFSFVCPTEVIAFQNSYSEFQKRNCSIAFVSVDTKHSLWHWQNVPRQYGGLGSLDIPLLSDATHKLGRDYGVLVEEEGVCLRGMFIIDGKGLVQQITLNNSTVGRSVLEALRLLEAFQTVAKHGVLCPVDWTSNSHTSDTLSTISNTLVESYEDRLANLQKGTSVKATDMGYKADVGPEFEHAQVADQDVKHGMAASMDIVPHAEFSETPRPQINITPADSTTSVEQVGSDARDPASSPDHTDCAPRAGVPEFARDGLIAEQFEPNQLIGGQFEPNHLNAGQFEPIHLIADQFEPNQLIADQGKPARSLTPITAVASPATSPGMRETAATKLETQERSGGQCRGTALHQDINAIFSHRGRSHLSDSSPSSDSPSASEE